MNVDSGKILNAAVLSNLQTWQRGACRGGCDRGRVLKLREKSTGYFPNWWVCLKIVDPQKLRFPFSCPLDATPELSFPYKKCLKKTHPLVKPSLGWRFTVKETNPQSAAFERARVLYQGC